MRLFLATLALFLWLTPVQAQEDLLEPEQAFRVTAARMVDASTAELTFQAANGYYLYRDKFKFEASGARLGTAVIPPGKVKQDEFFGRVETLRGEFRVRLPVSYAGSPQPFKLKAMFQGCADVGVCYPPQESLHTIAPFAGAAAPAAPGGALSGLRELATKLTGGEPELLPAEQAFRLEMAPGAPGTATARFTIAKTYYLYQDKIRFTVLEPAGAKVAGVDLPRAEIKDDPNFGKTAIYHDGLTATVRLTGLAPGSQRVKLLAKYQGCSEQGVCYPPMETTHTLKLVGAEGDVVEATPAPAPVIAEAQPAPAVADATSETGRIAAVLAGGSFWLVVASFFGLGLLLSLTPCVFPMIPILSSIIAGQKTTVTKTSGFLLSLAYVLGMAITYAIAGVAAALSGTLISNALQNPIALGIGALIFVALALSMFGFYDLQLPSALQSKFSERANRIQGGNFLGVFAMGALSAVILGPCVAPPLAAALAFIAQTGNMVLGAVALFTLALGMGVPLLLIGLSAGALLPKAGGWMNAVKHFFGVMMLAVAIYLIAPVIPDWAGMLLWALLLIGTAIYLHALDPLPAHASGWARLWKGLGVALLVGGLAILVGMLAGGRDVLQPLSVFKAGVSSGSAVAAETSGLKFQKVKSVAELDAALAAAQGKYVMLDFYADWCVSCKEFERFTFADARVRARLEDVVLLKADVTGNTAEDKALLKRFGLFGPPGILFFDKNGREVAYRVIGFEPAEKFLLSLDKAIPQ